MSKNVDSKKSNWLVQVSLAVGILASIATVVGLLYTIRVFQPVKTTSAGTPKSSLGPTLYVGSSDGTVNAITIKTGKELWQINYPQVGAAQAHNPASAVFRRVAVSNVDNNIIYVSPDNGLLYALDAATGMEKWRFPTSSNTTRPVAYNGIVYIGVDATLVAIKDGNLLWNVQLPETPISVQVSSNNIYVTGISSLYSFTTSDGKPAWEIPANNNERFNGVIIVGGDLYTSSALCSSSGETSTFYKLQLIDKKVLWQQKEPGCTFTTPTSNTLYGEVFDTFTDSSNRCFLLVYDGSTSPLPSCSYDTEILYFNGSLFYIDNTGLYQQNADNTFSLSVNDSITSYSGLIGEGNLLFFTDEQKIYAFDENAKQIFWSFDKTTTSVSSPLSIFV